MRSGRRMRMRRRRMRRRMARYFSFQCSLDGAASTPVSGHARSRLQGAPSGTVATITAAAVVTR
eukprot:3284738-Pyramimonas_sp.AAC.1